MQGDEAAAERGRGATPGRSRGERALAEGLASAKAGNWEAAAEAFRLAASLEPRSAEVCFRLGWALWHQAEEIKPTLTDLSVGYLAHLAGFDAVARQRSGRFSAHKRRLRDAVHALRDALQRDPAHARARYYLARALRDLGYREEALTEARRAAELDPSDGEMAALVRDTHGDAGSVSQPAPPTEEQAGRMGWADVVLSPRVKRELRQVQLMLEQPDLARELGVEPPTGILLKGPPGTGKTTIARVLANEARCRFIATSPAEINQMYVGESEKRVRDLFVKARAAAPAIIFIDEIDALLPIRQGGVAVHYDKVVNQFLQEMDGMTPNHRVLVLGATNRPDMLDPAVRRGGRLSREIEVPLPDASGRRALLGLFTRKVNLAPEVDLDALAVRTDGYSGADLRAAVNEAGLQALIRLADAEAGPQALPKTLAPDDFDAALRNLEESAEADG